MQKLTKIDADLAKHIRDVALFACLNLICILSLLFYEYNNLKIENDVLLEHILKQEEIILENDAYTRELISENSRLLLEVAELKLELQDRPTILESYSLRGKDAPHEETSRSPHGYIIDLVKSVCKNYSNVDPALALAVISIESTFRPEAKNGNNMGLMQINTRWHQDRATRLGVTDWYDPLSNIKLGVDYLSEIDNEIYKVRGLHDTSLTLMVYNMGYTKANEWYNKGVTSSYAKNVMEACNRWALEL